MKPKKDLKSHILKDKIKFVSPGVYVRDNHETTTLITSQVPTIYTVEVNRTVSNELLHPYNMYNDDWVRIVKERAKSDMLKELIDRLYDNGLIEVSDIPDENLNNNTLQMRIKVVGI